MNRNSIGNRTLATLLLVAVASASLAPTALADRGRHGRMGRPGIVRVVHRGPYFVERHSEAGALVGFLGGLVVGSILSSASNTTPPHPAYEYYDPFCRRSFTGVGAYGRHLDTCRHPREVEVIEVDGGRCVDTLEWRDGRWWSRDELPRDQDWAE